MISLTALFLFLLPQFPFEPAFLYFLVQQISCLPGTVCQHE